MSLSSIRLLIATLWCGSLWTIGYVVAPMLFATLPDRVLAGTIAGSLFRIEAWLSVAAAIVLVALQKMLPQDSMRDRRRFLFIVGMLACALAGYFGLHPFMAALRGSAGAGGVMAPDARTQFGILHGVSSALYLVESLLAVGLMLSLQDRSLSPGERGAEV
jgi:hypothetical protein